MSLYIGTNYHPHDWEEARWPEDIRLMKEAGFTTVRLGHLCWDSYEPEEGVYTFEWFDKVMDLLAEAHIGVVLDISMRPAPRWVHILCPGCDIYDKSGVRQNSLHRYMEDVADPAYQHYALRFAKKMANRYKGHPALFAFGLCNELGAGYMSYSPYAEKRFQNWLKKKYGTIECLNKAWAAQRWSRRYNEFGQVMLQNSSLTAGTPEGWLDMRRFFSDGTGEFISMLKEVIETEAPLVRHTSNHYAERESFGFDYLKYCSSFVDYPGMGMYPQYEEGDNPSWRFLMHIYMQRLAETDKPMWCLEFQTGSLGEMNGPYGVDRMRIFMTLIYRCQMVLGWTWRSMLGGEEQYMYGMLGHDGIPTENYLEYKQTAADIKKLSQYAFPYLPKPRVAVAYNYENEIVTKYRTMQYRQPYKEAMVEALTYFDDENLDYNIVDLRDLHHEYDLLVVPNYVLMSKEASDTIRMFVQNGGNVVMTGYSAMVDATGKVFDVPRPGNLSDVFGLRVAGFDRNVGEETISSSMGKLDFECQYREHLELHSAKCFAEFGDGMCAVSENQFGKGKAYYVATDTRSAVLGLLFHALGYKGAFSVPEGVHVRKIAEGQCFYVNTLGKEVKIPLAEDGYGVLSEREYTEMLVLPPFEAELVIRGTSMEE